MRSHKTVTIEGSRWLIVLFLTVSMMIVFSGLVSGLQTESESQFGFEVAASNSFEELQKIVYGNGEANDQFGTFLDVDGEFAVISAYATNNGGSAYVYQRESSEPDNWVLVKELTTTDGISWIWFGANVAISGDYIVAGAPFYYADGIGDSGAAYLFGRNEGGLDNWGLITRITPENPHYGDHLGLWLDIYGNKLAIGGATEGVHIYQQDANSGDWEFSQIITSDTSIGYSLSLSDNLLVTGVEDSGVHVYRQEAGIFTFTQKLTVTDGTGYFGSSFAIYENTIVVGSSNENIPDRPGSAYIFEQSSENENGWELTKEITSEDGSIGDDFGQHLSIWEDTVVVGARLGDVAYVFHRNAGGIDNWGQMKKLTASDDVAEHEDFGIATAVTSDTIMIGARFTTIGANHDQGATYVYRNDPGFDLNVTKIGSGEGAVTSVIDGIDCGFTCTHSFPISTVVTLTAVSETGSSFDGWSGACTNSSSDCIVTMNESQNVTATFTLETYELTVAVQGTGSGSVTSDPSQIDCEPDCQGSFDYGTVVTLTAVPETGSSFDGWSGACTNNTGDCIVTMVESQNVTATFTAEFKTFLPAILSD